MKRYDEALSDFNLAIELNPEDGEVFSSRGETYRSIGRYDEAIADLTRAIELNPDDVDSIARLAEIQQLIPTREDELEVLQTSRRHLTKQVRTMGPQANRWIREVACNSILVTLALKGAVLQTARKRALAWGAAIDTAHFGTHSVHSAIQGARPQQANFSLPWNSPVMR